MNHNDLDQRLDRAIDALNNEASPAPHEQGDPELFSLVDAARLAKSLRQPAEPDADFAALAVARISANLRQSTTTGNTIPPANTPAINELPSSGHDEDNPHTPLPWFRRYAELAAILLVLVLVGGGIYIYQSVLTDDDGSPAIGGPGNDNSPSTMQDPVEFVLAYQRAMEERDMETVRGMLVERFREFDDDLLWQGAQYFGETETGAELVPENWTVEHNEHFTVVRYTDLPVTAYVLRRGENNGWLVDRGESAYWSMQRMTNDDFDDYGGLVEGVQIERISDDLDTLDAQRLIGIDLVRVEPREDNSIDVTIEWMLTQSRTAEVALNDLQWKSGDDSGAVEVTWATARLDGSIMQFPALLDGINGSPTYTTTFTLYDVPDEGNFELHIPDMTVTNREGNEVHLTTIVHALVAEYPQPSE